MLYWMKFSICAEINTKHMNTLRGQNIGILMLNVVVHKITSKL